MKLYMFNIEIAWAESSGNLMLWEGDYDSAGGDPDVATQRLVPSLSSETDVETNALLFSKFTLACDANSIDPESPYDASIMVVHSVESDELQPYRPRERVHHDLYGVVALRAYATTTAACDDGVEPETELVMIQAYNMRLRHSESLPYQQEVVEEILDNTRVMMKELLNATIATVRSNTKRAID